MDADQASVARTGVKAMIPVGRPFLDYVLSALAEAGYRRICLIVAPDHQLLADYYQRQVRPERLSIEFAVQPEPRGTGDAVAAAERFAAGDPFLMINSDDYYPVEAYRGLRALSARGGGPVRRPEHAGRKQHRPGAASASSPWGGSTLRAA